jgi:hypothetical protein
MSIELDKTSSIKDLCKYIGDWRQSKGFITPTSIDNQPFPIGLAYNDVMLGKLMLVVSEVGEAAEAVRHMDFKNFKEELADTVIRIMDICDSVGIDLEQEIKDKMIINEQRPMKHGKKCNL